MRSQLLAHTTELAITCLEVNNMTKTEMLDKLKLLTCFLCTPSANGTSDCECVIEGIPCIGDLCGCIHKTSCHECGNVNGKIVFSVETVNKIRRNVIATANAAVM
jgi:hypothetical protein